MIVAWRAREDVLRCLESLDADAGLSYEAIVVDDGSGDGTVEAVRARHPEHTVLAKTANEGLVAGRNAALALVRGRFVAMLDADTLVCPGALRTLVDELEAQPQVGLVAPKLVYPDGRLQLSCRRFPAPYLPFLRRGPYAWLDRDPRAHRRHLMIDDSHAVARPVVWVAGAAQVYRAELPSLISGYDTRISSYGGEDLDWCLRVWRAGLEVRYVPEARIVHVWQQVTHRKPYGQRSLRQLRDWLYLHWKHRALRHDPRLEAANA
ncbi:MAG: glycosyltransferase family 2 protein [Solirubrobacteraceae bacterium MAG38_C4-C5]|nr:glycosyltransferase family 2 protein [Candidatus Siliceabacter maunaloa]